MQDNLNFWNTPKGSTQSPLPPSLPLIVWGDDHLSSLGYSTIISLLPYFNEQGYRNFGFEYDNQSTLATLINDTKTSLTNAGPYTEIVAQGHLSRFPKEAQSKIKFAVAAIPAMEKRLTLLENLQQLKWCYQGVDMNLSDKRGHLKDRTDITHQGKLYEERNAMITKQIFQLYSSQKGGVISLIGLRHFTSVSQSLFQAVGKENSENILFIHICARDNPHVEGIIKIKNELSEKYSREGISFKCRIFFDVPHSLEEIKKFIEDNKKPAVIKNVENSSQPSTPHIAPQQSQAGRVCRLLGS